MKRICIYVNMKMNGVESHSGGSALVSDFSEACSQPLPPDPLTLRGSYRLRTYTITLAVSPQTFLNLVYIIIALSRMALEGVQPYFSTYVGERGILSRMSRHYQRYPPGLRDLASTSPVSLTSLRGCISCISASSSYSFHRSRR